MKRILIGLGVMLGFSYIAGAVVMAFWWAGYRGPAGTPEFWSMGWWPWIFLGFWPALGVAVLVCIAYIIGDKVLDS